MLTSARKGKPVNEEEIPPPVALGGKPNVTAESETIKERELPQPMLMPSPPTNQKPLREAAPTAPNMKPLHLAPPQKLTAAITPETPAISPLTPSQPDGQHSGKNRVLSNLPFCLCTVYWMYKSKDVVILIHSDSLNLSTHSLIEKVINVVRLALLLKGIQ